MKTDNESITNPGFDYGLGQSNIDWDTGIRFGVIPVGEVLEAWAMDSEMEYGPPACPNCGDLAILYDNEKHDDFEHSLYECHEFACENCERVFGSESAYPESPLAFYYESDGYRAYQDGNDTDIFVEKSLFYTWCRFCSPCAPGAGYLLDHMDEGEGIKAYCFGHDWFWGNADHPGRAPYPVYSVETGELVKPDNN